MHELSITQQICDIAVKHGKQHGAVRVTDLYLVIGELSTVVDESVQFYWDMITEGTICEGAVLHFDRLEAEFKCQECGNQFKMMNGELSPCPDCRSTSVDVLQGKEFHLDSINISGEHE